MGERGRVQRESIVHPRVIDCCGERCWSLAGIGFVGKLIWACSIFGILIVSNVLTIDRYGTLLLTIVLMVIFRLITSKKGE